MVETKDKAYWDELSKEGKAESERTTQIEKIIAEYTQTTPEAIFNLNSPSFSFNDEFQSQLNEKLDEILAQYPTITPKEITQKKTKYLEQIYNHLYRIHIKNVESEISFDAYSLLKLAKALDEIITEAQFKSTKEGVFIEIMDPSRICLIRIKLTNESYQFIQEGKCCVNIEDLKKVLYCEANDKSTTTLEFGSEKLYITIHSKKFDSTISRTLEYLSLELEEIPLETLNNIKYPFSFALNRDQILYTMKNAGKYSEIVDITADSTDDDRVVMFSEAGQIGKGEVKWKKSKVENFSFHRDHLEQERKETKSEEIKEQIEVILKEQKSSSCHSLTFLTWLKSLANILEKTDLITFSIRNDHPMKVEMYFDKLGTSSLQYFLAPRATKNDVDDDEEFEEF